MSDLFHDAIAEVIACDQTTEPPVTKQFAPSRIRQLRYGVAFAGAAIDMAKITASRPAISFRYFMVASLRC
jgi:hypothetical protein